MAIAPNIPIFVVPSAAQVPKLAADVQSLLAVASEPIIGNPSYHPVYLKEGGLHTPEYAIGLAGLIKRLADPKPPYVLFNLAPIRALGNRLISYRNPVNIMLHSCLRNIKDHRKWKGYALSFLNVLASLHNTLSGLDRKNDKIFLAIDSSNEINDQELVRSTSSDNDITNLKPLSLVDIESLFDHLGIRLPDASRLKNQRFMIADSRSDTVDSSRVDTVDMSKSVVEGTSSSLLTKAMNWLQDRSQAIFYGNDLEQIVQDDAKRFIHKFLHHAVSTATPIEDQVAA